MKLIVCFLSISSFLNKINIKTFADEMLNSEQYMDILFKMLNRESEKDLTSETQSSQNNVFDTTTQLIKMENLVQTKEDDIIVTTTSEQLLTHTETENQTHIFVNNPDSMLSTASDSSKKVFDNVRPQELYLDIMEIFHNDTKKLLNQLRTNLKSFHNVLTAGQTQSFTTKKATIEKETSKPNILIISGIQKLNNTFIRKKKYSDLSAERSNYYSDDQYYESDDSYYISQRQNYSRNNGYVKYRRKQLKSNDTSNLDNNQSQEQSKKEEKKDDESSTTPNTPNKNSTQHTQATNTNSHQIPNSPTMFYMPNYNIPGYISTAVVQINIGL